MAEMILFLKQANIMKKPHSRFLEFCVSTVLHVSSSSRSLSYCDQFEKKKCHNLCRPEAGGISLRKYVVSTWSDDLVLNPMSFCNEIHGRAATKPAQFLLCPFTSPLWGQSWTARWRLLTCCLHRVFSTRLLLRSQIQDVLAVQFELPKRLKTGVV